MYGRRKVKCNLSPPLSKKVRNVSAS